MKNIAIIELGTTNVKLIIAQMLNREAFVVIDEVNETVKVSSDMEIDGLIKTNRVNEVITVLKSFKAICERYETEDTICIASNMYQVARNEKSFFEQIYTNIGYKFKILSNEEYTKAVYNAVINTLDIPKGVIVDVGGMCTTIIHYNRKNILNVSTIPYGALNLSETFASSKDAPAVVFDKMVNLVKDNMAEITWKSEIEEEVQFIGANTTYAALSKISRKLTKYPVDKDHNYRINSKEFDAACDLIKSLDIDKTKKIKGISEERADILASGLAIAKACKDYFNISDSVICKYGVSEGVLFNYAAPITLEKPISDVVGYSIYAQNQCYNTKYNNTENVYNLSMALFKQLKVLHRLNRPYVKILRLASSMYDAGMRINAYDYTKNGFYVIANSEIFGATHREIMLAAFVISCQNYEDFNTQEWVKYSSIFFEEDLDAVRKLACVVKLARALDRFGKGRITDINCDILGDSVIMKTVIEGASALEIREAQKVDVDFKRAFKKNLQIL